MRSINTHGNIESPAAVRNFAWLLPPLIPVGAKLIKGAMCSQRVQDLTDSCCDTKIVLTLLLRQQDYPVTMAKRLGESEKMLKLSSLKWTAT